jgi:hypothetical protein
MAKSLFYPELVSQSSLSNENQKNSLSEDDMVAEKI